MTPPRRAVITWAMLVVLGTAACGGESGSSSNGVEPAKGGEERTVLVDYRHDEFASAFLRYYPEKVTVRPGDVVNFRQTWTGEPHSVTMGKVVDDFVPFLLDMIAKYPSEEEVPPDILAEVERRGAPIPGMTAEGYELFQAGAQPCFIDTETELPRYEEAEASEDPGCVTKGRKQPAFDGRAALYNSGFIPPDGAQPNEFTLPIATDAEPGTYQYFCNYHWVFMSGEVEIVSKGTAIPSQQQVNRKARAEIEKDAEIARQKVDEARDVAKSTKSRPGKVGDLAVPLAGRESDEEFTVIVNEFLPARLKAKVGEPVTWAFEGITHTVSFNVPKYFPIFTVAKDGFVAWNPKAYEPVGWEVPERAEQGQLEQATAPEPRAVDVGRWDGKGGFHSSGAFDPGERFTVTFTKAGTYPVACVLHPQMVGTVEVE